MWSIARGVAPTTIILCCVGLWLVSSAPIANANLCDSVKNKAPTAETGRDVDFYQQLFPDSLHFGNRRWNEIVLQCNRQRDTKGKEVAQSTSASGDNAGKQQLKSRDLPTKVIPGHFNFFGKLAAQLKY